MAIVQHYVAFIRPIFQCCPRNDCHMALTASNLGREKSEHAMAIAIAMALRSKLLLYAISVCYAISC